MESLLLLRPQGSGSTTEQTLIIVLKVPSAAGGMLCVTRAGTCALWSLITLPSCVQDHKNACLTSLKSQFLRWDISYLWLIINIPYCVCTFGNPNVIIFFFYELSIQSFNTLMGFWRPFIGCYTQMFSDPYLYHVSGRSFYLNVTEQ